MLYPLGKENDAFEDLCFTYTLDVTPVLRQIDKAIGNNKSVVKTCLTKHLSALFNICDYEGFIDRIGDDLLYLFYVQLYGDGDKAFDDPITLDEGDKEQVMLSDLGDELEELYHETAELLRHDLEDFLKSKNVDLSEYTIIKSEPLTDDEFCCFYLLTVAGVQMTNKMQSYIQYLVDKENT